MRFRVPVGPGQRVPAALRVCVKERAGHAAERIQCDTLPPGCATALDIEAQTIQSPDLLQGRPLPPAAATPFAAAIERYYHRNDPAQSTGTQGGSQAGGDQPGSSTTTSAGATGVGSASPLLGPLPTTGQTAQ